jgi:DNA-binding response OmpR family regulator
MTELIQSPLSASRKHHTDILLIEDYEELAQVLQLFLESQGYTVRLASSIAEAVDAFRADCYRLVLSDWALPDGTGEDAIRKLRRHGRVRAIALSGYEGREYAAACREAGFCEYLVKPVNDHQLLSTIRRVLGN